VTWEHGSSVTILIGNAPHAGNDRHLRLCPRHSEASSPEQAHTWGLNCGGSLEELPGAALPRRGEKRDRYAVQKGSSANTHRLLRTFKASWRTIPARSRTRSPVFVAIISVPRRHVVTGAGRSRPTRYRSPRSSWRSSAATPRSILWMWPALPGADPECPAACGCVGRPGRADESPPPPDAGRSACALAGRRAAGRAAISATARRSEP
jgi:hypothetical protein